MKSGLRIRCKMAFVCVIRDSGKATTFIGVSEEIRPPCPCFRRLYACKQFVSVAVNMNLDMSQDERGCALTPNAAATATQRSSYLVSATPYRCKPESPGIEMEDRAFRIGLHFLNQILKSRGLNQLRADHHSPYQEIRVYMS